MRNLKRFGGGDTIVISVPAISPLQADKKMRSFTIEKKEKGWAVQHRDRTKGT
jgi:hypothetical protein